MPRTNFLRRRAQHTKQQISDWATQGRLLVDKTERCVFLVCDTKNERTDCNILPKLMFKIVKRLMDSGTLFHSVNESECKTLYCEGLLPNDTFHIENRFEPQWVTVWPLSVKPGIEIASAV